MPTRRAAHAGTWYNADSRTLRADLEAFIADAGGWARAGGKRRLRALVVPHAGYDYSASTAAHAYRLLRASGPTRIVVLGPSHHSPLRGRAGLPHPSLTAYDTPLGPLPLDLSAVTALRKTGAFVDLPRSLDELEHSIEMQLPYLRAVFGGPKPPCIVPVMVGSLSSEWQTRYAELLSVLFADPNTCFVVSTDFCHWGTRFDYFYGHERIPETPPHTAIRELDERAIDLIRQMDPAAFREYLGETGATICGRNAVLVLLELLVRAGPDTFEYRQLAYRQSDQVKTIHDTSVSYVAGCMRLRG